MRKRASLVLVALLLACATNLTETQKAQAAFYTAETAYITLQHAATIYIQQPGADVKVIRRIALIDQDAYTALMTANVILGSDNMSSADKNAAMQNAAMALKAASIQLQAELNGASLRIP